MFTDTHTHIYTSEFDNDRSEVVARAIEAGVNRMILPNIDCNSIAPMKQLAASYPDLFRMAMGLHPSEVDDNCEDALETVLRELHDSSVGYIAVGEVGVDLYWDKTYESRQMYCFDRQVREAVSLGLPVIIHCREALDRVLEVLSGHRDVRAVFHCFGGTVEDVRKIRALGDFYFGIGGVVTFKKSSLPEVLPEIGLERILLETDSPYLAPTPWRGKRNESGYLVAVADKVADVFGVSRQELGDITSRNSVELFGF